MDSNLLKTKSIEQLVGDAEHGAKTLKRTLSGWDLTLLGIGARQTNVRASRSDSLIFRSVCFSAHLLAVSAGGSVA